MPDPSDLARRFLDTADHLFDSVCPLCARLAREVAASPDLLALAAMARPGQPEALLLMVAVHHELLRDPDHELSTFFSSLSPHPRDPGDAPTPLHDFVRSRRDRLEHLLRTQVMQTAEVRRCATLLPGLGQAWRAGGGRPLALLDLGAGAGLTLLFDRFLYRYSGRPPLGPVASEVVLDCDLRGPAPEVAWPEVSWRLGLEQHPLDLGDPDCRLWMEAHLWPNRHFHERARRLRAALRLAEREPPPVRRGDMIEDLLPCLDEMPPEALACLVHCYSFYELTSEDRERLDRSLEEAARRRPLVVVGLEWDVHHGAWLEMGSRRLARAHVHGEWLEWAPDPP